MRQADPFNHYCKAIQRVLLSEGGSKITEPHAGITSDMKGKRWTIHAFDTDSSNKKETPSLKELAFENNAGIMEIAKFYRECDDPVLMDRYERLVYISQDRSRPTEERQSAQYQAWKIIQDFTGVKLQGDGPWVKGFPVDN